MCNLYNLGKAGGHAAAAARAARELFRWNEPELEIYPNRHAPIIRVGADGVRELVRARWGMPSPPAYVRGSHDPGVTNIRNTGSLYWRTWLGPGHRCLVPFTAFAEPNPAARRAAGHGPNAWFALGEERELAFFAGLWTPWTGKRMAREARGDHEVFGILTCEPNTIVAPIHRKAMPVILTAPAQWDAWLTAPWPQARALQRPLADDRLIVSDSEPARAAGPVTGDLLDYL